MSSEALAEQLGTWLEIQRARGSENCPDRDRVFAAVQRLFPERPIQRSLDPIDAMASASVQIRPTSMGHEALLRVTRPREGERVILDQDNACDGLANAIAVALVMLIEPPTATRTDAPPLPPESRASIPVPDGAPPQAPPTVTAPPPTKDQRKSPEPRDAVMPTYGAVPLKGPVAPVSRTRGFVQGSVGVMGVGAVEVLGAPAGGFGVRLALNWGSGFGLAVDGLRLWSSHAERAPGFVEIDLWGWLGGPCYRPHWGGVASLDGCLLAGSGTQRAESVGYVHNGSKRRDWLVAGPRLGLNLRVYQSLIAFANIDALGQLRRHAFSVERVGVVAEAPTIGCVGMLGLKVDFPVWASHSR